MKNLISKKLAASVLLIGGLTAGSANAEQVSFETLVTHTVVTQSEQAIAVIAQEVEQSIQQHIEQFSLSAPLSWFDNASDEDAQVEMAEQVKQPQDKNSAE